MLLSKHWDGVRESGVLELVGVDEQVDQNDYSQAVSFDLPGALPASGLIVHVTLIATEDGAGAVPYPSCELYLFDADPGHASGATAITAAQWPTCIGVLSIASTDWKGDANGKVATVSDQVLAFHAVDTLYFVLKNLDATAINDAAGDDEQIELNVWYTRESGD